MKDTPNVPPYSQGRDEIEEAGYKGTELVPYGYLPFEVSKLRDDLERRGLTLTSAFTIFNFLEAEKDEGTYREAMETVQVLSALGCKHLVLSDVLFEVKNRAQRAGRVREEDSLSGTQRDAHFLFEPYHSLGDISSPRLPPAGESERSGGNVERNRQGKEARGRGG